MKLKGRVAIITGAGGWLGRGIGLRLAEEGAQIVVNDKDSRTALETVDLIISRNGKAMAHGADVTKTEEVHEMIQQVIKEWGQVDILVNNAGAIRDALLTKMTDEDWDFVVDLDLKGSFICGRAVASHMMERGYGKIVNISSMSYRGNVGQSNYVSAKAGVVGLTQALGLELARYGINVNCIAPGFIDTPKNRTLDEKVRERLIKNIPLRRAGEIVDIANAVLFLVSDESKYITRQVIHVSGGMEGFWKKANIEPVKPFKKENSETKLLLPPGKKGESKLVDTDEGQRPDMTPEELARLPLASQKGGTVTAGNSSGLNDRLRRLS